MVMVKEANFKETNATVWTGYDVELLIFKEDVYGEPIGMPYRDNAFPAGDSSEITPDLSYCFAEAATASYAQALSRRPSTGAMFLSIVSNGLTYVLALEGLYSTKYNLYRSILMMPHLSFTIVLFLDSLVHVTTQLEQHIFHGCKMQDGAFKAQRVNGESGLARFSTVFWAEEYVQV